MIAAALNSIVPAQVERFKCGLPAMNDCNAEIRRMEADADYDRLRKSGELHRRRDERAMHEEAQQRMSEGRL